MSVELHVFLPSSQLPTSGRWNEALKSLGFPLVIDEFDPESVNGFLPASLNAKPTGFEVYMDDAEEIAGVYGLTLKQGQEQLITIALDGDQAETAAAMGAVAALCSKFGGSFFDPEVGDWVETDQLVSDARGLLKVA